MVGILLFLLFVFVWEGGSLDKQLFVHQLFTHRIRRVKWAYPGGSDEAGH